LCQAEKIAFVLGHALYMKAIHVVGVQRVLHSVFLGNSIGKCIKTDAPRRPAPMPIAGLIPRANAFPLLLWLGCGAFLSIIFPAEFPTQTQCKTRWAYRKAEHKAVMGDSGSRRMFGAFEG
jgi:hypothetical protein